MNNSSVYEMIIERGMKQGIKDSTIESILVLLDRRFEINTAPVLTPLLDLQKLKHLFQEAIIVEHLEDFILISTEYTEWNVM